MHAPVHVNTLVLDYNGLSVDCAILHLYLHVCLITEYCGTLNCMHALRTYALPCMQVPTPMVNIM